MTKLKVVFPCEIEQVAPNAVMVNVKPIVTPGQLIDEVTLDQMAPELGGREVQELVESIHDYAVNEIIRRSIIIRKVETVKGD